MDDGTDPARLGLNHEFVRYHAVSHAFRRHLSDILPAGVDPAAVELLAWLVVKGPKRQGELAEVTFLDPSTVSRRISQLVTQGLVQRQADSADGRAVQLVPTVAGKEFYDTMQQRREQIMQAVLADWSNDDLVQLSTLLRRFNDDFDTRRKELRY